MNLHLPIASLTREDEENILTLYKAFARPSAYFDELIKSQIPGGLQPTLSYQSYTGLRSAYAFRLGSIFSPESKLQFRFSKPGIIQSIQLIPNLDWSIPEEKAQQHDADIACVQFEQAVEELFRKRSA